MELILNRHDLPPHLVKPLRHALGFFAHNWGELDTMLDIWCAITFHSAGGENIEYKIPMPLKERLSFLRKSFSGLLALRPFKVEALQLLSKISPEILETRNAISHGYCSHIEETEKILRFTRLKITRERRMHQITIHEIRLELLRQQAIDCQSTVAEMIVLTNRLINVLMPADKSIQVIR